MGTPASAQPVNDLPSAKSAGDEPLPGYRLIELLGRGGFGEVWKCEAPGGLHKAIKFVPDDSDHIGDENTSLHQEYEAFQKIKAIRHPFLLTLERVELLRDELIMVMELADQQLQERFNECRGEGLPGIPRDDLVNYLADAAEALDVIGAKHGLQHLDVKPANLFLVGGHGKVGDFGLVGRLQAAGGQAASTRGLTPRYVAPEILRGHIDTRSDQYSLALVYQELLTGHFPYTAKSIQQMLLQHTTGTPDLSALPPGDRPTVARALAKDPNDRFPSCLDFIRGLLLGDPSEPGADAWKSASVSRSAAIRQSRLARTAEPAAAPTTRTGDSATHPSLPQTIPAHVRPAGSPLPLIAARRSTTITQPMPRPAAPPPADEPVTLVASGPTAWLRRVHSVVPVAWLRGENGPAPGDTPPAAALIETVVRAVSPGGVLPGARGAPARLPDGSWTVRFPLRALAAVARLKLDVLREQWQADLIDHNETTFILRKQAQAKFWGRMSGKKGGLELVVRLSGLEQPVGEAEVTGRLFGAPEPNFARTAGDAMPEMMDALRKQLQNVEERRAAVRVPADVPVTLFSIHGDGGVRAPVAARCRDVSMGGICCLSPARPEASHVFVAFDGLDAIAEWAVLMRLNRCRAEGNAHVVAGRFRTDL